jgi:hypothetical protein
VAALDSFLGFVRFSPPALAANNARFRQTTAGLQGLRIFSTVPRMALLDPYPALMEPFLLTYMSRLGKANMGPILKRMHRAEFDIAITANDDVTWRGVQLLAPQLRRALMAVYKPYCVLSNNIVYLPLARPTDGTMIQRLSEIGCVPYSPAPSFP